MADIAYLRILNGDLKGGVFVLSDLSLFEIGRAEGCHVRVPDEQCGLTQARLTKAGSSWRILNLNDERKTFVNDIPIDSRPLAEGDILRVGRTELHFTFDPPKPKGKKAPTEGRQAEPVAPAAAAPIQPTLRPQAPAPQPPAPVQGAASPGPQLVQERPSAPTPMPEAAPASASAEYQLRPAHIRRAKDEVSSPAPVEAAPPQASAPARPPQAPPPVESASPPEGELQESVTELDLPPVGSAANALFKITVIDGNESDLGRDFHFAEGDECILGRSISADFVLMDGKISRNHCTLRLERGHLVLTDLGSSNGTIVNGERVQRTVLADGDYIRLGFTVLGCTVIGEPVV